VSTNNGGAFSYISPYTTFPASPPAFAGGFCCDQRVAQDPARRLVFWYLQYNKSESANTNGVRIAVAHGQADLASNTWQIHDFTPADFGYGAGYWLDFPHMKVSANYLYFTSNVFTTSANTFSAAVIARIPLAALDSNAAFTLDTFVTTAWGSIAPVDGATDTMYFSSMSGSNSIKVLRWPEADPSPTVFDVVGLATTTGGTFSCPTPDFLDPCTRADRRMQTGWISGGSWG
jgi:hypothetical protein